MPNHQFVIAVDDNRMEKAEVGDFLRQGVDVAQIMPMTLADLDVGNGADFAACCRRLLCAIEHRRHRLKNRAPMFAPLAGLGAMCRASRICFQSIIKMPRQNRNARRALGSRSGA